MQVSPPPDGGTDGPCPIVRDRGERGRRGRKEHGCDDGRTGSPTRAGAWRRSRRGRDAGGAGPAAARHRPADRLRRADRGAPSGADRGAERYGHHRSARPQRLLRQRPGRQGRRPHPPVRGHRLPRLTPDQPRVRRGGRRRGPALRPRRPRRRPPPRPGRALRALRAPTPVGDRTLSAAVAAARDIEQALVAREEAAHLLSRAGEPPRTSSPAAWEEVREIHGELRTLAGRLPDPALRAELLAACTRLARAGQPGRWRRRGRRSCRPPC